MNTPMLLEISFLIVAWLVFVYIIVIVTEGMPAMFYPLHFHGRDNTGNAVEANIQVAVVANRDGFFKAVAAAERHLSNMRITNVAITCRHKVINKSLGSSASFCRYCHEKGTNINA